jgi:hypothetical protein
MVKAEVTEYTPNETGQLATEPEIQRDLHEFSIHAVARVAHVSENTVKAGRREGKRLRRSIVPKLRNALNGLRERAALKQHADVD